MAPRGTLGMVGGGEEPTAWPRDAEACVSSVVETGKPGKRRLDPHAKFSLHLS